VAGGRAEDSPALLAVLSLPKPACPCRPAWQTGLPKPFKLTPPLELQTWIISSGGFVGLAHKWLATAAW